MVVVMMMMMVYEIAWMTNENAELRLACLHTSSLWRSRRPLRVTLMIANKPISWTVGLNLCGRMSLETTHDVYEDRPSVRPVTQDTDIAL